MITFILGLAAVVLGLMALVVFHEFGHWIVARLCGMWTPVFSIGFGPRKYSLVLGKFWDTEFRLSPIPLGGYVALPEMGDETSAEEIARAYGAEPRPFKKFPIWQRMLVAVAGVVMNIIVAAALLFGIFACKGQPTQYITSTFVAAVSQQVNIASQAGLQAGDVILSADGKTVVDPQPLVDELHSHPGKPVVLHIRRASAEQDITVVPNANGQIGISIGYNVATKYVPMSVPQAAVRSTKLTFAFTGKIFYAIAGMAHLVPSTPGADASSVHSIVGIAAYGANTFKTSFVDFLVLLASISLNLAVFNILPIPMLDGGYVLFFSIEKLRGKPLSVQTQNKLKMFFLYLLLMLFIFGIVNDVRHPMGK
ncbi:MAG TPA: M50 family metallopeptidase [Planktothrix sp.]|jgi:regulator of sigma E protease